MVSGFVLLGQNIDTKQCLNYSILSCEGLSEGLHGHTVMPHDIHLHCGFATTAPLPSSLHSTMTTF